MRILLVEDDVDLGAAVQRALSNLGYAVDWLKSAEQAQEALSLENFDIILLDLTLPRMDGLSFLQSLRAEKNQIAIIILTARESIEDRVKGLELGADDYLSKPFEISELNARIKAVWRRLQGFSSNQLIFRDIQLDLDSMQLKVNQSYVPIQHREFEILRALIESQGRILSKTILEEKIYSWSEAVNSNSIEVHIHNLRKKLPKGYIQTVRGLGYRLIQEGPK